MITDKYKEQLRQTREGWEGWGSSAARNCDGLEYALRRAKNIRRILDFGCGTGALGKHILPRLDYKPEWIEYDPSVPGKDKEPQGQFDMIVSIDVMEHVEPQSLDETLEWMKARTSRMFHHIDCNSTNDKLPDGRDVHLIVKEPEWWEAKLVPPAHGWAIMYRGIHDKRKRGRFPRRSCTFHVERQG